MKRRFTFDPYSIALGLAVGIGLFVTMGQSPTPANFPSARFTFGPHPRDFVTIREGMTFTVPAGQVLVPTAIGPAYFYSGSGSVTSELRVNGQLVDVGGSSYDGNANQTSVVPIPAYLAIASGSIIECSDNSPSVPDARVWGYLASDGSQQLGNAVFPRVEFGPKTSDLRVVAEGAPFTVPTGKLFVVTALGDAQGSGFTVTVLVDGVKEFEARAQGGASNGSNSHLELPHGLTVPAGSTIQVTKQQGQVHDASAWGYLADT